MRRIRILLVCSALAGCSGRPDASLNSPSGDYTLTTGVSGPEAGPTHRDCVVLKFKNTRSGREVPVQAAASVHQKWAVAWSPAGSLVLYSSDIGTTVYDIGDMEVTERVPDGVERGIARDAYEQKYGSPPPK